MLQLGLATEKQVSDLPAVIFNSESFTGNGMLTQERLKEILDYDEVIGEFYWKVSKARNIHIGDTAGHKRKSGYVFIAIDSKGYMAHRLVWLYMTGKLPNYPIEQIDHINGIKDDNSFNNLRLVDEQDQHKNVSLQCNNKSGYRGVCWKEVTKTWYVDISSEGVRTHLGSFKNKDKAILARKKAEFELGFHENHGREQ